MTEQTSTAVAGEQNEQTAEKVVEFAAITSQEAFDAAIQARIARERSKFADYDEVKAKADKLAEIEAANLTEAEKTAARLEAAEKRAAELEIKASRAEVAAEKGVPAELLSGSTREELEASADALIAFKGVPASGPYVPAEGKSSPALALNGDGIEATLRQKLGIA